MDDVKNNKKKKRSTIIQYSKIDEETFNLNPNNDNPLNLPDITPINKNPSKKKEEFREISINKYKTSKQTKLTLLGDITVYFPYKPYPNQISYMKKVLEAYKNHKKAALESPTDNLEIIDKTEEIRQPVIFYASRIKLVISL